MFGIEIDINNPALEAIARLECIASKELYENMREDLRRNLQTQYKSHRRIKPPIQGNVYSALKRIFIPAAVTGVLTGSTINSIGTIVTEDGVFGGPVGSWPQRAMPSPSPSEVSFQRFADDMVKSGGWDGEFVREHPIKGADSFILFEWSDAGVNIEWPEEAKRLFNLEDKHWKPEAFAGKMYGNVKGRAGKKMEDFFDITPEIEQNMMTLVEARTDYLWEGVSMKDSNAAMPTMRVVEGMRLAADAAPESVGAFDTEHSAAVELALHYGEGTQGILKEYEEPGKEFKTEGRGDSKLEVIKLAAQADVFLGIKSMAEVTAKAAVQLTEEMKKEIVAAKMAAYAKKLSDMGV